MGALILGFIVIIVWGLFTFLDKNTTNKNSIILSEIIIMILPYMFLGFKLSELYWEDKISDLFCWFIWISFTFVVVCSFKLYNKRRFKKIDNNSKSKIESIRFTPKIDYYSYYQKSLKNKDGRASYWGELYYYNLYNPQTIFQQNQIQLKIQNDILSHS